MAHVVDLIPFCHRALKNSFGSVLLVSITFPDYSSWEIQHLVLTSDLKEVEGGSEWSGVFVKPRYAVQINKCVIIYPADHMCNMFHPKRRMEILKMIVLFSANLDVLCLFVQLSMGDKIFVPLMGDILVDSGNLAGKSDGSDIHCHSERIGSSS